MDNFNLGNVVGIAKGPTKHQRTKWLICTCLNTLHSSLEASCAELESDIYILTLQSIRSCCSRMALGYKGTGKPRYKRHYLHRMHYPVNAKHPQTIYKLLSKGQTFLIRMAKEHPDDVNTWRDQLISGRQLRDEMAKFMNEYRTKDGKSDGNSKDSV